MYGLTPHYIIKKRAAHFCFQTAREHQNLELCFEDPSPRGVLVPGDGDRSVADI